VLLFSSLFLSGIKLVSELMLHIVLVSMAVHGRHAQANQTQAVPKRNWPNIELKNLRRDVQQLQLCLERFAASEHDASHDGLDVEDPSHELIYWNSSPTYDEDFVESYFSNCSQGFVDEDMTSTRSWNVDPIQVPISPITRACAKKFQNALIGLIQGIWAQASTWRPIDGDERNLQPLTSMIQVQESQ
jgi:hypothetical protein